MSPFSVTTDELGGLSDVELLKLADTAYYQRKIDEARNTQTDGDFYDISHLHSIEYGAKAILEQRNVLKAKQ
jgi:hypothetical protein